MRECEEEYPDPTRPGKKASIAEKLIRWRRHPQALSAGLGDRGGVRRAGRHRALVALLSDLSNARSSATPEVDLLGSCSLVAHFSRLPTVLYILDRENQSYSYYSK